MTVSANQGENVRTNREKTFNGFVGSWHGKDSFISLVRCWSLMIRVGAVADGLKVLTQGREGGKLIKGFGSGVVSGLGTWTM